MPKDNLTRNVVVMNSDTNEISDRYRNVLKTTNNSVKYQAGKGTMTVLLSDDMEIVEEEEINSWINDLQRQVSSANESGDLERVDQINNLIEYFQSGTGASEALTASTSKQILENTQITRFTNTR